VGDPPALLVTVALEAPPAVRILAASFADELRLLDELENRDDLLLEIVDALGQTVALLRERARMAKPGDLG
jgi:hypothetical protein